MDIVTYALLRKHGGGGASDLEDLTDINITSPTDGQVLKYDATNQKWVNGQGGGDSQIVTDALEVFKKLDFSEKFANASVTSPFVKNGNAIASSAKSNSDSETNILSTTKVDLTDVGYFVIDVYRAAGFMANWYPFFYVCQDDSTVRNTAYPSSVANKVYLSNVGKYYLDTSSLTGEWYIGFCTGGHTNIVCEAVGKLNDTLPITTIEVVANPQGTPVGTLNTIQIGDVIYELPSGGGGKSFTNVTYNSMSNNGISTTVTVEKEED